MINKSVEITIVNEKLNGVLFVVAKCFEERDSYIKKEVNDYGCTITFFFTIKQL